MIAKIIGVIWVLLGGLWLINPELFRRYLSRKMTRRVRRIVLLFLAIFLLMTIGSVFKAPGMLPKVIGLLALIIVIKGIMFITSRTSEKFLEWVSARSTNTFRIWALFVLFIGIMLLLS